MCLCCGQKQSALEGLRNRLPSPDRVEVEDLTEIELRGLLPQRTDW